MCIENEYIYLSCCTDVIFTPTIITLYYILFIIITVAPITYTTTTLTSTLLLLLLTISYITILLPIYHILTPLHNPYYYIGYGAVDASAGHTLYTEYQQAPRAKIFRRDQGTVGDLQSMQYMMR